MHTANDRQVPVINQAGNLGLVMVPSPWYGTQTRDGYVRERKVVTKFLFFLFEKQFEYEQATRTSSFLIRGVPRFCILLQTRCLNTMQTLGGHVSHL